MFDSVRPHGWQPTRLPRPWDSPGKNTGVGCHFPLQCMKVKSESEDAQSCLTLSDPMDCSLPGSSAPAIFQARALECVAIAFSNLKQKYMMKDILVGNPYILMLSPCLYLTLVPISDAPQWKGRPHSETLFLYQIYFTHLLPSD